MQAHTADSPARARTATAATTNAAWGERRRCVSGILRRSAQSGMRLVLLMGGVGLWASGALAQTTRFEWPTRAVDVASYLTAEECLAATSRVGDSVATRGPVRRDTTLFGPEEARAPLAAPIVATARRCAARFDAPKVSTDDLVPLLTLYMEAERDTDAATLVTRRLATVGPTAERERAALLDTIARTYLTAQPARLLAAQPKLVELERLGKVSPWDTRMRAFHLFLSAAWRAGDTARAEWAAQRIVVIGDSLTEAERRSSMFTTLGTGMIYNALSVLTHRAALDSLWHGTEGYVALRRSMWAKASFARPTSLSFPIGEPASAIEGDSWFRRGDTSATRPTHGKVALIVFLGQDCPRLSTPCDNVYAALRRYATRFPELEITVVAQTQGYLQEVLPPTPQAEAELLRQWWHDFHRVPGALAVATTPFWRLKAPDRRRINREVANITHYSFGKSWTARTKGAFLVDRSGVIVYTTAALGRDEEPSVAELVEILMRRDLAGS